MARNPARTASSTRAVVASSFHAVPYMKPAGFLPPSMNFQVFGYGFRRSFMHLFRPNVAPVLLKFLGGHLLLPGSLFSFQPLFDPVSQIRITIHRAARRMRTNGVCHKGMSTLLLFIST